MGIVWFIAYYRVISTGQTNRKASSRTCVYVTYELGTSIAYISTKLTNVLTYHICCAQIMHSTFHKYPHEDQQMCAVELLFSGVVLERDCYFHKILVEMFEFEQTSHIEEYGLGISQLKSTNLLKVICTNNMRLGGSIITYSLTSFNLYESINCSPQGCYIESQFILIPGWAEHDDRQSGGTGSTVSSIQWGRANSGSMSRTWHFSLLMGLNISWTRFAVTAILRS